MKKKQILVAAIIASALTLTACSGGSGANDGPAAEGETYNWDMTISSSEASTWWAGAEKFGELLAEKSDGRMKLSVFAGDQLSGGDQVAGLEMLTNGDKAFAYYSTVIYSGVDPRFGAVNAPFLYESHEQADETLASTASDAYSKLTEDLDIQFLGFGESGFRQITNSKRPITTPEDVHGLKLRVAGPQLFLDIFRELGADPITMNFAEVFTSLQNGTIDGQENPIDAIYANGLPEVQEYMSVWNYVYDPLILGMNIDLFNSLSAGDQKIVIEAAAEANEFQIAVTREAEAKQLVEMKETMTVSELSPEQIAAFREALRPVYDLYADKWTAEVAEAVKPN